MEEVGKFLEGRDPQERIVNLLYNYQNNYVTVVYRNEKDQKCTNDEPFFPFVWATKYACLKLAQIGKDRLTKMMRDYGIWVKKLSNKDVDGNVIDSFNDGYMFQFYATKPLSYQKFLEFFRNAGNAVYSKDNTQQSATESRQYLAIPPQEQFLIQTGKRFFKGYDDYDQLLRMIFDLETTGLNPRKDRIKLNGVKLNRPVTINGVTYKDWGRIFDLKGKTKEELDKSELEIIEIMLKLIYTFKPDVITAHNGENFDWNFLIVRCEELGTSMEELSRKYFNGDYIRKEEKPSILKLGGEIEEFFRTIVPNTTVTDSLHAVRRAQATDSNFLKADLKYSSKYLGLKKDNRVYTPGSEIDKILTDTENQYAFNDKDGDWYVYDPNSENGSDIEFKKGKDGDRPFIKYTRNYLAEGYELVTGRYIIERYLLDDLWECDRVEYTLNSTDFMLTKMIPLPFSKCCTMGTAGQWKAIMLAWSYENGLAIPLAANTGAFTGGLSRLVKVGYVDNVVKLDFNSLYPSIILTWAISDENDLMKAMLYMLEYVLTTREKYKGLKKSAGKVVEKFNERNNNGEKLTAQEIAEWEQAKNEYKSNDNRQMVVKKLGNSFFGSYGSNNGAVFPWKSTKCAEQTTCTGRQCLRLMISHFHNLGYQPIVGDTDGFNFKLPDSNQFRYTKEHPYIGLGLNREVKEGKEYVGFEADVAEFNDMYMKDFHYSPYAVNKMGLGIDEVVTSTINFSRKNYADYFPENPYPDDVKLVGNTIKSKKMPEYIAKFLAVGIRLLLQGKGQQFLDEYYNYIGKIYNYKIPLRDIATKGKIKKSIEDYKKDIQEITKAGRPKSRQAWYELAIKYNLIVDNGDTVYYINTGKSKSHSDVKKVTHYYYIDEHGERVEFTKDIDKKYKVYKSAFVEKDADKCLAKQAWIEQEYPSYFTEDEIIFNCVPVPNDVINSEKDELCSEENGIEYNVAKYVDMFNKRITPLLVCFSREIRDKILIDNPEDRQYFTKQECELTSGEPNKPSDQDTYEQLMTMEDKEIKFWMKYNLVPPFLKECEMGEWEDIVGDYKRRKEEEERLGIDKEKEAFNNVISLLDDKEISLFEDEGEIPKEILKICDVDPITGNFVSKRYKEVVIGSIYNILEAKDNKYFSETEDIDVI